MTGKKQAIMGVGGAIALVVAAILIINNLPGRTEAGENSRLRTLIDAKSGEVFVDFRIDDDQQPPYENPSTKARTLYPAEACYWTREGGAKLAPTFVFLKEWTEPGADTVCPDCGKPVRRHNPMPPTNLLEEAAKKDGKIK